MRTLAIVGVLASSAVGCTLLVSFDDANKPRQFAGSSGETCGSAGWS